MRRPAIGPAGVTPAIGLKILKTPAVRLVYRQMAEHENDSIFIDQLQRLAVISTPLFIILLPARLLEQLVDITRFTLEGGNSNENRLKRELELSEMMGEPRSKASPKTIPRPTSSHATNGPLPSKRGLYSGGEL